MTVMWALEADTVEYGEYLTGVRIEGLTYSLFSFTRKCGQAIGGSIPAFILGLSGYIANQEGILFTDPRDHPRHQRCRCHSTNQVLHQYQHSEQPGII